MKIRWTLGFLILGILLILNISKGGAEGNWTRKADMPTARSLFSTAVVDGKIYVIGGEVDKIGEMSIAKVERYDPKTDTWEPKADMPTARVNVTTAVVNEKIYVIGGAKKHKIKKGEDFSYRLTELSTVEMYDPVTDTWTQKSDMPTPRSTRTCVLAGKIYAIGGSAIGLLVREREPWRLKTVEVYDPATDTWRKSQSLLHARDGLTTTVVDGKIYAIGGTGWPQIPAHPGPFLASVEVFNPKTHRWGPTAKMPAPKSGHTASAMNGKIYIIGGGFRGNGPFMYLSTIEIYDPQTDKWTQVPDMPVGKFGHAAEVINGKIYILGGLRAGHKGPLLTVEVYEPGEVSQSVNPTGKLLNAWGLIKKAKVPEL